MKYILLMLAVLLVLSGIYAESIEIVTPSVTEAPTPVLRRIAYPAVPSVMPIAATPEPLAELETEPDAELEPEPLAEPGAVSDEPEEEPRIAVGSVITGQLSYYDVCYECCGKTDGVTASGMVIYNGMEDPYIVGCNWLPFGTVVEVEGQAYTVADRGGSGLDIIGNLDVFCPEGHNAALELGVRQGVEIKIVWLPE